jgi:molybdopterin synthase catalytic subunit/molybdopterin converting factor small subunit
MHVQILSFGVLKDHFGGLPITAELPEGATVDDLLVRLQNDSSAPVLRGIAVSVNAEYANRCQVLRDGDEVGLLPPVSGGTKAKAPIRSATQPTVALIHKPIDAVRLVADAKHGEDGAVVVFDGIVRNNSRGRETLYLDYEAYEEMATKQMADLALQAREKYGVSHVTILHRLGRLAIGETSVLIVVASAHRGQAFDACRWLIDTLKKTVPIWKKETFADGVVWADGEPFPAGLGMEGPYAS